MTAPAQSESATVRRHASAFARTWPEPVPYVPPAPVRPTAVATTEVGGNRTKRRQLVKLAEAHGWDWRASATDASIVIRFRRSGVFAWDAERAVAHWSGTKLPFAVAFGWRVYGGVLYPPRGVEAVPDEPVEGEPLPVGWIVPVRFTAAELAEYLASARCR